MALVARVARVGVEESGDAVGVPSCLLVFDGAPLHRPGRSSRDVGDQPHLRLERGQGAHTAAFLTDSGASRGPQDVDAFVGQRPRRRGGRGGCAPRQQVSEPAINFRVAPARIVCVRGDGEEAGLLGDAGDAHRVHPQGEFPADLELCAYRKPSAEQHRRQRRRHGHAARGADRPGGARPGRRRGRRRRRHVGAHDEHIYELHRWNRHRSDRQYIADAGAVADRRLPLGRRWFPCESGLAHRVDHGATPKSL
mmetsp:Transcript_133493/g.386417  ORF Transcript_133493/g.386417 Transcript_133493/m.386417 type:complete len:252 (-) Transcript_133493:1271-2026(-)